jgi:ribosomal protein L7/L12
MPQLPEMTLCIVAVFAIFVLARLSTLEKRIATLSRIDAKLDLLLRQAGVEYDPHEMLMSEIAESLKRGDKITAIRNYREATGVGLKEAKDFVEKAWRDQGTF